VAPAGVRESTGVSLLPKGHRLTLLQGERAIAKGRRAMGRMPRV